VKLIKIVHPQAGESYVPASAVKHWETSGWSPADETQQAEQASAAPAVPDPPAASVPDETTPPRRRTPKESE
jgi:hypothetical protein